MTALPNKLYTVYLKWNSEIIDRNLKMDYRILTVFNTNIPSTTGCQTTIQVPI